MKSLNQEILKFDYDQNFKDQDFYVSKSNEFSFLLLNSWPKWEKNFINLIGEKFSGKSHLVSVLQLKSNMQLKNADDNRSYTANILTDVIAFIGAGWIILRGYALDEGIIGFIGSAIFTIHLMQLIYKRGIPNIPF